MLKSPSFAGAVPSVSDPRSTLASGFLHVVLCCVLPADQRNGGGGQGQFVGFRVSGQEALLALCAPRAHAPGCVGGRWSSRLGVGASWPSATRPSRFVHGVLCWALPADARNGAGFRAAVGRFRHTQANTGRFQTRENG